MKIPKEINTLLRKRKKLAEELMEVGSKLDNWLEEQGMDLTEHTDYTITGCMIYCEPGTAERLTREAIEAFEPRN